MPPRPTGSQHIQPSDAGIYIAGVPTWWHPIEYPDPLMKKQVETISAHLLTMLSPEAFKAKRINGLLLYGPPGKGKTSSGIRVLYEWGKRYVRDFDSLPAAYVDFGELMLRIRSSWRKDAVQTTAEIHAELLRPSILMIDDVGKRAAPEDQETLSTLINARINAGPRPTIVTTNCLLHTAQGRQEFIASCDSRVLERYTKYDVLVDGENLRRL